MDDPLALVSGVGHLVDKSLPNQCCDDFAQRCPLEMEQFAELALPRRPVVRELVQHVPLSGAEVVRAQHGVDRCPIAEVVPLRPGADPSTRRRLGPYPVLHVP